MLALERRVPGRREQVILQQDDSATRGPAAALAPSKHEPDSCAGTMTVAEQGCGGGRVGSWMPAP